jgi:hypothetical protein
VEILGKIYVQRAVSCENLIFELFLDFVELLLQLLAEGSVCDLNGIPVVFNSDCSRQTAVRNFHFVNSLAPTLGANHSRVFSQILSSLHGRNAVTPDLFSHSCGNNNMIILNSCNVYVCN